MIVDVFCGAGGASEGAGAHGLDVVGIERDPVAAAVHQAAGHRTIAADVASFPLAHISGVEGLWMSPPCPDFSLAGNGAGLDGESGPLVWEVRRWALGLRPRWVACEHRHNGSTGGTSLDGPVHPPVPTHQRYRPGEPAQAVPADLFHPGRLPWVSMADALGWGYDSPARTVCGERAPRWLYDDPDGTHGRVLGFPRRDDTGTSDDGYRERDWFPAPAPTLTEKARSMVWRLNGGVTPSQPNRPTRTATEPAPTIAFGHDAASWVWERPATTIMGDPRVSPPGHHDGNEPNSQHGPGTVRLTVAEAATLQGFRAGYPWPSGKAFRCIGNAVPPPLAAACIGAAARIPVPA